MLQALPVSAFRCTISKLKDFDWPISIDFHASGRRGTSDLSTLGVGWVLNASGYVSREIKERPDEDYTSMEIAASNTTDLNYGGTHYPYDRVINADLSVPYAQGPGRTAKIRRKMQSMIFIAGV